MFSNQKIIALHWNYVEWNTSDGEPLDLTI